MVLAYYDINSTSFILSQPYALHSLLSIIYPIDPGSSGTAISVAAVAAVRRFRGPGSFPGPHHWPPGGLGRHGAGWDGLSHQGHQSRAVAAWWPAHADRGW